MEAVGFADFDREQDFLRCMKQAKSFDSRNFVLEFNASNARCAFDVGLDGFKALLATTAKV